MVVPTNQTAQIGIRMGGEYWYSWSVYIPSDWDFSGVDDKYLILGQFHGTPDNNGEPNRSPPLACRLDADKWRWEYRCDPLARSVQNTWYTYFYEGDATADAGRWVDWAVNVKWSYNDGFVKIYKNQVLVAETRGDDPDGSGPLTDGCISYNDQRAPYFKLGIYQRADQLYPRIMYYDSVKIGDKDATLAEMSPSGSAPPLISAPKNLKIVSSD